MSKVTQTTLCTLESALQPNHARQAVLSGWRK